MKNWSFCRLIRPMVSSSFGDASLRQYRKIPLPKELRQHQGPVNICEKWGTGPGGFHKPAELQRYMMCFGPVTGYAKRDGSEPLPLPDELISLAEATVQDAQPHLNELPLFSQFLSTQWLHQDREESSDSLITGLPMVTISIGEGVVSSNSPTFTFLIVWCKKYGFTKKDNNSLVLPFRRSPHPEESFFR
ncbi:hypothetical protein L1987_66913 [Smallanthus sonchifolius]|uniref:Uncharacterized protein n=1 Tax=Smallanthus sonchifolius TaxID=185202 RepID=A0ACB9BYS7_9ASTR|nr:hypothetical protein L1987_66913 [Smallanthus sonchifolius]